MAQTEEAARPAGAPDGELAMTAAQRYESLAEEREAYLMRARDAAKVTIPGLMPPLGATGATILPTPYQSVGARGVNNLASKLLLALFPAGSSFVRLVIDNVVIKQIQKLAASTGAEFDDVRAEFEEALAECEKAIINRMESKATRTVLFEALKQLIVVGNVLIHILPDGRLKMYRLDSYVVKRDHEGNVLEIVIKEVMSPMALDPLALAIVKAHGEEEKEPNDESHHKGIEVFTRISRIQNRYWKVSQEICGYTVPGSHGTYPLNKSAFLALRWAAIPGEDYGRAFAEEYLGDLKSLEGLSMAIVEWAAAASKIIPLVEPGSVTDINKLQKASSGQFVPGNAKDVTFLMIEKFADFRVVKETKDDIEKRLEQAFMLVSGAQRDAERVTAEEIRTMVQELETGLGGVYSILGAELQYPIVARYMLILQREHKMPALPEKSVQPQIITGLDGLGRSSDLQKLDLLFSGVGQEVGQQALAAAINVGGLLQRRATALGIDIDGLVKTPEEVQNEQAQAQKAEMVKAAIPNAVKAASDHSLAAKQAAAEQGDQDGGAQPPQASNASTQS